MVDSPVTPEVVDPPATPEVVAAPAFSWKSQLPADFTNSAVVQKYEDSKDGLAAAIRSNLDLTRMLGNEKVPIPKSKDDPARAIFNKALGIPDSADGYALPDVEIPDTMKGLTFDKKKFQETVHAHDLTPAAAKGLWDAYTSMSKQAYADAVKSHQEKITGIVNQMRQEWGDAYQSKVELGQMVINKFSENQEMTDFVTSVLSSDPRGIKFLSKIGDQFAENKIGDFKYQRHALTPDEAQREIDLIRADAKHPYNDPKAPEADHARAVEYVNSLISVAKKPRGPA